MKKTLWLCCVLCAAALTACGCTSKAVTPKATTVFLDPGYASKTIETIALLPMANVSGEPDAEKILGNAVEAELASRADYSFLTVHGLQRKAQASGLSGDLESLRRQWMHTREFKADIAGKLANKLKVDAFLVGEITRWEKKDLQPQERGYPQTAVSCRVFLMDGRTGEKLWEAVAERVVKGQYYDPTDQEVTQFVDEAGIVRGSGGKPVRTVEAPALREVAADVAADIVTAIPARKTGGE